MDSVKIVFIGLCMFAQVTGGRLVILPNVSSPVSVLTPRGATCVEAHVAYIAAKGTVTCEACEIEGGIYRLFLQPGDQIAIEGIIGAGYDDKGLANDVPKMQKWCPAFRLKRPLPADAITLNINKGVLTAKRPKDTGPWQSTLTVTIDKSIRFVVTNGSLKRTMEVSSPTMLEIVNGSVANFHNQKVLAENHWLAYYSLAALPVICDSPEEGTDRVQTTLACSNSQYP